MSNEQPSADRDPRLDELLEEMAGPPIVPPPDMDALFRSVESRVRQGESGARGFFRSRSTVARRLLALSAFAVVALIAALAMPPPDWSSLATPRSIAAFAALATLLAICLGVALRPLHAPALTVWQGVLLAKAAVVATVVLALVPVSSRAAGDALVPVMPCMMTGLLLGIPVYAVARVLDRGTFLGPLLAASAAGLAGNFALQIHCPAGDVMHNIEGHASVAAIFVLGVAAVEVLSRRLRL